MHMDWQSAAVYLIGLVVKLLEKLGVEHTDNEVKGTVIVRDHRKDNGLFLTNTPKVHFVRLGNTRQGFQIELFQSCHKGDLNGF